MNEILRYMELNELKEIDLKELKNIYINDLNKSEQIFYRHLKNLEKNNQIKLIKKVIIL